MSIFWTIVTAVTGVFVVGAAMAWASFRAMKWADRLSSDLRYRRRRLIFFASLYVSAMVVEITEVVRRNKPAMSLVGLIIPLFLVYWLLRTVCPTKVPPDGQ